MPVVGKGSVSRVNKDVAPFLQYFLPKGQTLTLDNLSKVVRQLHRAFKDMETDEVYDALMEQLLRAIAQYDPEYTDKVNLVVETIKHELPKRKQFTLADVNRYLDLDSNRYLRMLCRRGFLEAVAGGKNGKISGFRPTDTWPPPAEFFRSGAIGVAYYLQKWFRSHLQDWSRRIHWIPARAGEV